MRLISRSSHEAFSECKRKGYWGYLYKRGLEPTEIQWPLVIGIAVHEGLETLFQKYGAIESAVDVLWDSLLKGMGKNPHEPFDLTELPFATQQNCFLAEALLRGWHRARWERFNQTFEVLHIEEELRTLLAPNIKLMSRCDLVVRDRASGSAYVVNWKTTKSIRDWDQKWEDDIQAWTEALAAQEHIGIPITGVIFEGFYKHVDYKGINTSPLVTGYEKRQDGHVVYSCESQKYSQANPWVKFQPWREGLVPGLPKGDIFKGGLKAWIDWLPIDVVDAQFITSSPILKNDDMVRDWLVQVIREETDIEAILDPEVSEADRLSFFKQNKGENCRWCQFRPACRWEISIDDMLASGILKVRRDHHLIEGEEG